jgi:cullin-associated NEDD8-dissociated protein 1
LFDALVSNEILPHLSEDAALERQRTTVLLVAAIARTSALQIAPNLGNILPGLLRAVQKDDEELREGSLQVRFARKHGIFSGLILVIQALETLVLKCPTEVTSFLPSIIQVGTQLVKFDPVCVLVYVESSLIIV